MSGLSLLGMGLALSRGELKIPPLERGPPCCRAFGPRAQRSPSPARDLRLVQTGGLNLPGLLSDPAANAAERDPDEKPELCLHTKTSCLARPGATSIASVRQAPSATARIRLVLLRYPRQGAPRGVHRRKDPRRCRHRRWACLLAHGRRRNRLTNLRASVASQSRFS